MNGVCDEEHVWRDVYSNRDAKYFKGLNRTANSLAKNFFGHRRFPISEISSNLYDRVSLGEATAFGDERAGRLKEPDTVKGWWKMLVADLRNSGCSVVHSPAPDNEYHAGIIIPEDHCDSWEDAQVYLLVFLSNGSWQGRAVEREHSAGLRESFGRVDTLPNPSKDSTC